jgi:chaperonin cofactor prefoldin
MTRMMNDTIDHTSQQMQHQTQMHNQLQAWTQQTAMQGANLDNQPQRIANACSSIQSVQAMFRH